MLSAFSSNWLIFFPLAFSLYVAMRLAEGKVDMGQRSTSMYFIRGLLAVLFSFSLLAIGLRTNALGFSWLVLLGIFGGVLFWKNRRLERSALLLTALNARHLPQQLSVTETFWLGNRGWIRRQANALRRDLSTGTNWWVALQRHGIAQGAYAKLALRMVAKYGDKSQAARQWPNRELGQVEMLAPLQVEAEAERLLGRLLIFSWVALTVPVFSFVFVFLFPTFKEMFEEFGLPLPWVMQALVLVADSAAHFGIAMLLSLVPVALLGLVALAVTIWFFPRVLQWPILRWLCGDYYRNLGFTALAAALDYEPNLRAACLAAAQLISVEDISRQYRQAAHWLEQGAQPKEAFLKSRLLTVRELEAVHFGFDQRDPTWCLKQLAAWRMARMLGRYSMLVQWAVFGLTILLAVAVGGLAVGMIQALTTMITSLS